MVFPREISNSEIEAKKTDKGGWTKATLAEWGVPWPAPKGWRKVILKHGIPYEHRHNPNFSIDQRYEDDWISGRLRSWISNHGWQVSEEAVKELDVIIRVHKQRETSSRK